MDQLIPITTQPVADDIVQTVDARELHAFLEVGKDFTTWVKGRIGEYGFVEKQDYEVFENLSSPKRGNSKARAQRLTEYRLTLDMAKELAMVEKNEKGRMARRYFIEVEKRWRVGNVSTTQQEPLYTVREAIIRPGGHWGRVWAIPVYRIGGSDYWNVHLVLEAFGGFRDVPDDALPHQYAVNLMKFHPDLAGAPPLWVAKPEGLKMIVQRARGCFDKQARDFVDLLFKQENGETQQLLVSGYTRLGPTQIH